MSNKQPPPDDLPPERAGPPEQDVPRLYRDGDPRQLEAHDDPPAPPPSVATAPSTGEAPAGAPEARQNPYVGPLALAEGQNLFGRDRERRELLNRLIADRLVLLYSPSGAGKTSLVQAGLIPQLRREKFKVLPLVRVGGEPPELPSERSSEGPTTSSSEQPPDKPREPDTPQGFNRYTYSALLYLEKDMPAEQQRSPLDLAGLTLKEYLAQRPRQPDEPYSRVLIFDQFEEILTRAPLDQAGKLAFFEQVGEALLDHDLWALFVIREDFLAGLEPYLTYLPTYLRSTFRLTLLESAAAMLAICKPVEAQGILFQGAAAGKLVEDLSRVWVQKPDGSMHEQPGLVVEPVQLQVVCRRLYRKLDLERDLSKTEISLEDVTGLGDVNKALAEYYASEVADIATQTGVSERDIRDWCGEKLVTENLLRGQVLMGEGASGGLDNQVIRLLEDAHLLRAENRRNSTWFELAHDRLVRPILEDNQEWAQKHLNEFQRRATEWVRKGRPSALLLRGFDLRDADILASMQSSQLNGNDRELLTASREAVLQNRTVFQIKADEWHKQSRPDQLLMTSNEIVQAQKWISQHPVEASSEYMEYLSASQVALAQRQASELIELAARHERELREQTTRRMITWLAALVTLALLVAVYAAWQFNRQADKNALDRDTNATQAARIALERDANSTQAAAERNINATQAANNQHNLQMSEATAVGLRVEAERLAALAWASDLGRSTAEYNASLARAGKLAFQSQSYFGKDLGLSALLGIEAYRTLPQSWEGRNALLTSLQVNTQQQVRPYGSPIQTQIRTIQAMAFSPDGKLLAWCGFDGKVKVWDLEQQTLVNDLVVFPEHGVNALVFSPTDSRLLITGTANGYLTFWDLSTGVGKTQEAYYLGAGSLSFRSGQLLSLAISPNGKSLAVSGINGNVVIWDTEQRRAVTFIDLGSVTVRKLAWSPSGDRLAGAAYSAGVGSNNTRGVAYIWNPDNGAQVDQFLSDDKLIFTLDWSPNGEFLAFAGGDLDDPAYLHTIWLHNTRTRQNIEITGQEKNIRTLAFDQDSRILAAGSQDGTLRLWDISLAGSSGSVRPITQFADFVTRPPLQGLTFAPKGQNRLAYFTNDKQLIILDVGLASPLNIELAPASPPKRAPLDSRLLAIGFDVNGQIRTAGRQKGKVGTGILGADFRVNFVGEDVSSMALGPGSQQVAIADPSGDLSIRDTDNRRLYREKIFPDDRITGLAFNPAGNLLAIGLCRKPFEAGRCSAASEIQIYDYTADQSPFILKQDTLFLPYNAIAFSPDGQTLAGSADNTIYLWNLAEGTPLGVSFIAPQGDFVTALAFSPDGVMLASGNQDGSLALWDIVSRQQIGQAIRAARTAITGLLFTPDMQSLITAEENGAIQRWDLDPQSWIARLCSLAGGRKFSQEEFAAFFPGREYIPTCGEVPKPTATPGP